MKRIMYLATAAFVAMLILAPAALAKQDDDPCAPEQGVAVVGSNEELEQIAGQPRPSPHPGQHPGEVPTAPGIPGQPQSCQEGLPQTGGPSPIILPAATLLLVGYGVLAYAALRRRSNS